MRTSERVMDAPRNASGAALRVGLVGINFAPEPTGIGPYTSELAQSLAASGAEVRVVTGFPHYPQWERDPSFRDERQSGVIGNGSLEIRRVRSYIPRRQSAFSRARYEWSFLRAAKRWARGPVDVVIGVTPSLAGAAVASRWARRYGVPSIIIVQDLVGPAATQSGLAGSTVGKAASWLERRVLARADHCVLVTDSFRPTLNSYGVAPADMSVIQNWTKQTGHSVPIPGGRTRASIRTRLGWDPEDFVVLHTGNMGFKQGLESVVDAARLAEGSRVRFVLVGDGNQRRLLEDRAAGAGNLDFLPLAPEAEYQALLGAADLLLLNERPSVLEMCLPSKLTSYFVSGTPVLAAVAPRGAAAQEIGRSRCAALIDAGDPLKLLSAVQCLMNDVESRQRLADAARHYASRNLGSEEALARYSALIGLLVQPEHQSLWGRRLVAA